VNALDKILRTQRLLSNLPARWTGGFGRPSTGKAREAELERFTNPPKIGRPTKESYAERGQLTFDL
jgi:hypothetical protein